MNKWGRAKIGEVSLGIYDGPHATPAPCETPGPYFLGIPQISPLGFIDMASPRYIAERDYGAWTKRVVPQYGDVVFSYEATLNLYALIPRNFKCCLGRRMGLVRPNPKKLDFQFLYYYFFSPEWRGTVRENTITGATVDRLSIAAFPNFEIALPPLPIQRRIAAILSDYDSAIDNARRQIALLEEAAMRLYREWFDGTGKGWKRTPVVLADVLERLGTGLNPRKNFTLGHGENFYVTIKNMANNRVYLDSKCDKVDDEAIRKINRRSDLRKGDVLFSGIGTIGRAYLIAEAPKNWNTSESVFNLRANSRITPEFLYMLMLSSKMQQYAMNNATGCAQKGIRAAALRAYRFDLAPFIEIEKFTEQVRPMLSAVNDLNKKIDTLTEARDRLLPKLMSGEIEV